MDFSTSRVTVPEYVMARAVGGEMVILNLDSEQYYGLDAVGASMWTSLTTTSSIQEAYEALKAEYDVEADLLRHDLEALITDLARGGLLEVDDL